MYCVLSIFDSMYLLKLIVVAEEMLNREIVLCLFYFYYAVDLYDYTYCRIYSTRAHIRTIYCILFTCLFWFYTERLKDMTRLLFISLF